MSRDIRRVGVVGGGRMGAGIAEVCARAGLDTVVCEVDAMAARAARERVSASLDRAVRRGKPDRDSARDALARPAFTQALEDLADRQLVVEAVVENADAKTEIFTALDKIVEDPGAILATNTSSLPIMRLGMATGRADRVVGLDRGVPLRRVQGTALRPASAAPTDGGGRAVGPRVGPRVPRVRPGPRGPVRHRLRGRWQLRDRGGRRHRSGAAPAPVHLGGVSYDRPAYGQCSTSRGRAP